MTMNIRQAARWADRKGILYTVNRYTGQPDYLYAVYSIDTHIVECIGSWEKCKRYRQWLGSEQDSVPTADGRWLKTEALDTIVQQMDEAEGEERCAPSARELAWGAA